MIGLAGHFWSLSIEEQFYLVWPSLLLLLRRRHAASLAITGAIASAALRLMLWNYFKSIQPADPTWFWCDGLLIGCLFALLLSDPACRERVQRWSRLAPLVLIVYVCCVLSGNQHAWFLENICLGLMIAASALNPYSVSSRILSFAPLGWLGRISYSLYVWQEFFMQYRSGLIFLTLLPIVVLGSHYAIEVPFTRLGRRLIQKTPHRLQSLDQCKAI